MRRSVNDAERRGKSVIQSRCGFAPVTYSDGWFTETKAMIAKAYEVWRKKRGVPRYDHFGCCGIKF
jgi:allantoicase